jgi:hypothetical protein
MVARPEPSGRTTSIAKLPIPRSRVKAISPFAPGKEPWFDHFMSDVLPLDDSRIERITDSWRHLERLVAGDRSFDGLRPQIVAQGSFAAGTAIRPLRSGDEFDVDLVIKLTLPPRLSSDATLDWLRGCLAVDGVFKKRLVAHPRCVRVSYAGDFHLDVVPARRVRTRSPISGALLPLRLKVPDRSGGWRFSNPEGFVAWCRSQDRRTGGDFSRVVMMHHCKPPKTIHPPAKSEGPATHVQPNPTHLTQGAIVTGAPESHAVGFGGSSYTAGSKTVSNPLERLNHAPDLR